MTKFLQGSPKTPQTQRDKEGGNKYIIIYDIMLQKQIIHHTFKMYSAFILYIY